MLVIMKRAASKKDIKAVAEKIKQLGFTPHLIEGVVQTVIGAVGDAKNKEQLTSLVRFDNVESVVPIQKPYKLASRTAHHKDTIIDVSGIKVGGDNFTIIAGPCSVESEEQIIKTADTVLESGASMLRGGAYKPRTSPYSFQGLKELGLQYLAEARKKTKLPVVTELISVTDIELMEQYVDIVQIGARNMQNFCLLQAVGKINKPVLLKRGMSATLEELLMSAEYIMSEGNYNVIICERGIRTFEPSYRNTLDLNAVPALKSRTHLPIFVDPSHGTGKKDLIVAMSKAAIAAGADGLIIEVHPNPEEAFSDGPQSLTPAEFANLMKEITPFIKLMGKKLVITKDL